MHFAEPDVGIGLNTGDQSDWISYAGVGGTAGTFRRAFGSTYVQAGRVNDTNRITYYTPRIEGVQFGISYVPNSGEDSNAPVDRHTALADGYAVGLNFKRDLGGFALGVSGGFGTIDDGDGADPTSTNIGITLAAGGFKGGVSFADSQDDPSVGDMNGMSVGISYATGPMTVGLSYWDSERDGGGTALVRRRSTPSISASPTQSAQEFGLRQLWVVPKSKTIAGLAQTMKVRTSSLACRSVSKANP